MAILEVRIFQTYFGQQAVNVFHFLSSGTPAVVSRSFACAAVLGWVPGYSPANDDLKTAMQDIQTNDLTYTEIQVVNPYDPVDFYVQPIVTNNTGNGVALSLSPAVAMAIRTNRVRQDIRRGFKRFTGIGDGAILDGGVLAAAKITTLQTVCDALNDVSDYDDEGNTLSFESVVVGKERYTTPSGGAAYRYYATEAEQLNHIATGIQWAPVTTVRTQVSRQYGRGV